MRRVRRTFSLLLLLQLLLVAVCSIVVVVGGIVVPVQRGTVKKALKKWEVVVVAGLWQTLRSVFGRCRWYWS